MIEISRLNPHDALPEGRERRVVVFRRFDEDEPNRVMLEIRLEGGAGKLERASPTAPDGTPMTLEQAIDSARAVAESEGLDRVYVLDRTAGDREQDILRHGGDHSIHMEALTDTDPEDGETGSDMRDRHV